MGSDDDEEDKGTVTRPVAAGILDQLVGDSDDSGNLTERGVVVTETVPKD